MEMVTWSIQKSSSPMNSPISLGKYLRKIIKVPPKNVLLAT